MLGLEVAVEIFRMGLGLNRIKLQGSHGGLD